MNWINAKNTPPPTDEKTSESEYLLCVGEMGAPFVGWYNSREDKWTVAHHLATSEAVSVRYYRPLPKLPKS